ncbi:ATP-dependent sacrificial sulfur transferase LarE [Ruminococcaceae bacterium OttesenSCG-928-L11]|nr:ATP-dependent sacrificial sulfur transferase LarE [Ruminococcaceae bacterium OttesenSCG-928-L11]
MEQLHRLEQEIAQYAAGGICVAFSGGVDSALLLALANRVTGGKAHAVTVYTPFHSPREPEAAEHIARELGGAHRLITLEKLPDPLHTNPVNRCYLCKRWIFETITDYAKSHGLATIIDGTNADDLQEYRPGLKALAELGIISPLARLEINKATVREIAAQLGVSVAKKPSAPCLATRFPYDTPIDFTRLHKLDEMEEAIRERGIATVRVRTHGDIARIEVPSDSFPQLLQHREQWIALATEAGFTYVTLDMEGFSSGSMDKAIRKIQSQFS